MRPGRIAGSTQPGLGTVGTMRLPRRPVDSAEARVCPAVLEMIQQRVAPLYEFIDTNVKAALLTFSL